MIVEYAGGRGEDNAVVAISSKVLDHLIGSQSTKFNSNVAVCAQLVLPTVDYGTEISLGEKERMQYSQAGFWPNETESSMGISQST